MRRWRSRCLSRCVLVDALLCPLVLDALLVPRVRVLDALLVLVLNALVVPRVSQAPRLRPRR